MASPADAEAVAVAQANGIGIPNVNGGLADADASQTPSQLQSQAHSDASQASGPSTKRKREDSDDGFEPVNDAKANQPSILISDDQPLRDEKKLIQNYFQVLQRYATAIPTKSSAFPYCLQHHFLYPATIHFSASGTFYYDVPIAHGLLLISDKLISLCCLCHNVIQTFSLHSFYSFSFLFAD